MKKQKYSDSQQNNYKSYTVHSFNNDKAGKYSSSSTYKQPKSQFEKEGNFEEKGYFQSKPHQKGYGEREKDEETYQSYQSYGKNYDQYDYDEKYDYEPYNSYTNYKQGKQKNSKKQTRTQSHFQSDSVYENEEKDVNDQYNIYNENEDRMEAGKSKGNFGGYKKNEKKKKKKKGKRKNILNNNDKKSSDMSSEINDLEKDFNVVNDNNNIESLSETSNPLFFNQNMQIPNHLHSFPPQPLFPNPYNNMTFPGQPNNFVAGRFPNGISPNMNFLPQQHSLPMNMNMMNMNMNMNMNPQIRYPFVSQQHNLTGGYPNFKPFNLMNPMMNPINPMINHVNPINPINPINPYMMNLRQPPPMFPFQNHPQNLLHLQQTRLPPQQQFFNGYQNNMNMNMFQPHQQPLFPQSNQNLFPHPLQQMNMSNINIHQQGKNENEDEDSCESDVMNNELKQSKGKSTRKKEGEKRTSNMNNLMNQEMLTNLHFGTQKNQSQIPFPGQPGINNQMFIPNQPFPFNPSSSSNLTTLNSLNNNENNYNPMLHNIISFDEHEKHDLSQDSNNEDIIKNNDFYKESNENDRKQEVFPHHSLFTSEDLKEMGFNSLSAQSQSQMKGGNEETIEEEMKNLNIEDKETRGYLSNSKKANILSNLNNKEENSKNKLNASAKGFIPKSNIK